MKNKEVDEIMRKAENNRQWCYGILPEEGRDHNKILQLRVQQF